MADVDDVIEGMAEEAVLGVPEEEPVEEMEPVVDEERELALKAMYGETCPFAVSDDYDNIPDEEWTKWARDLWQKHADGIIRRMHIVRRNRLFYRGKQWITQTQAGPYQEAVRPRDAVRAVHNLIQPALDQRIQIVTEQRPGFRTKPMTQDTEDLRKAEAQQYAIEYQFDQQQMERVLREAVYWAQQDGVSFMHLYWDADAGPWDELVQGGDGPGTEPDDVREMVAESWEAGGKELDELAEKPVRRRTPLGDLRTRVHKIEEVRVSAEATATQKPNYWIIKNTIPLAEAARRWGHKAVEHQFNSEITGDQNWRDAAGLPTVGSVGLDIPGDYDLLENQQTTDMFTIYCEPSEHLPDGLQVVVVGEVVVYADKLLFGVVPMVRITDGSPDPNFFPAAMMEGWIDHQMRINALISKWIESVRVNSGGRFLMKQGTNVTETLVGGLISALEVRATGGISDAIMPVSGFAVGGDVKELLQFEIQAFEQKSGWNDTSRGSISSSASGRAIIAIREQLERVFAPVVAAASAAMTDWAKVCLHGMRWGYDMPRNLGVFGKSRPDLAREVKASDFDGVCDVEIDPETLMPMPRALRLFLLDQMYEKGQMQADEYRRRMPFAFTRNMASPDDDHDARAKRVCDALLRGVEPPPIRWQDNEAIHQNVLEREIILNDSVAEEIIQKADERWKALAAQAAQKQGAPPAQAGGPPSAPGGGELPPQGPSLPEGQQPFLSTDPGVATGPVEEMTGMQDIGGAAGVGYDFNDQF